VRAAGAAATTLALFLAACGGGEEAVPRTERPTERTASTGAQAQASTTAADPAFRFLTQASFGPTPASVARVQALGAGGWIDEQMALPWQPLAPVVEARWLERLASDPKAEPDRRDIVSAFWKQALTGEAQLRWRVAFALSQIFVVSTDSGVGHADALGTADFQDLLARHAFGSYRQLLERVTLHPAMGNYLSHLGNRKADPETGRVPDENFAREVMQLFSIGLVRVSSNGRPRTDSAGQPIATYTNEDVTQLARVFTGWSWDCPGGRTIECFRAGFKGAGDVRVGLRPMVAYPEHHSTDAKRFLGTTIAAQATPDPAASLRVALDTLAAHPNVGPFLSRQLIQRLVVSNPSGSYVSAVAAVWNDDGRGVRGNLGAVVRAILLHPEAQTAGAREGKLREPVLRLAAFARAFPLSSASGHFDLSYSEPADAALGQVPMKAPSVFAHYRPDFAAPGSAIAAARRVAPEMQLVDDTSVASHVNFMRRAIESGFGAKDPVTGRRDVQIDTRHLTALAETPEQLVDDVFRRLFGAPSAAPALRSEIVSAISAVPIPVPKIDGSNASNVEAAKLRRARAALLFAVVSPEFNVQK
jgi:uncharacterized protein (DUF1800 family)